MPLASDHATNYAEDRQLPNDRNATTGRSAAAEALFDEASTQQAQAGGGTYIAELTTSLQQQELLPVLTLEWTRSADQFDLDRDGNTNETIYAVLDSNQSGDVSLEEIEALRNQTAPGTLENVLLQVLGSSYEELRFALPGQPLNGITVEDIGVGIQQFEAIATIQADVANASARLLANDALFDAIDIANNGGTPDGHISRNDLEQFLESWDNGTHPVGVKQADVDAVRFLYDNWDEPYIKGDDSGIRDTKNDRDTFGDGDGITRNAIRVNFGLPTGDPLNPLGSDRPFLESVARTNSQFKEQYQIVEETPPAVPSETAEETPPAMPPETPEESPPAMPPELASLTTAERQQIIVDFLNSDAGQASLKAVIGEDGQLSAQEAERLWAGYASQDPEGGPPVGARLLRDYFAELAGEDGQLTQAELTALGVNVDDMQPLVLSEQEYIVEPGQGFDVIARDIFTTLVGRPPTVAEEIAFSEMIAAGAGNDRQNSNGYIHPDQALAVPNIVELVAQAEAQGINVADYIRQQTAGFVDAVQQQPEPTVNSSFV